MARDKLHVQIGYAISSISRANILGWVQRLWTEKTNRL
jgi:hypothetical protein